MDDRAVLQFWFHELDPRAHWSADPALDRLISERFSSLHDGARQGELWQWRRHAHGRLAEIIVLDQFSRHLYRDDARSFAQDGMALALAQEAVAADVHHQLSPAERAFLLLPYMHSESRAVHAVAERLYRAYAPADNLKYELLHKAIIDRFGRYPHRNAVLGRESTAEEIEFLKQPGSRF